MSRSASAIAQASREAAEAVGAMQARRAFTITKFAKHPDGYYHARVTLNGQTFYLHAKFGSWLAPGHTATKQFVLKEPEALLGDVMGREVKFTLAERARTLDYRERQAEAAAEAAAKAAAEAVKAQQKGSTDAPTAAPPEPGLSGQAVPDAGVPAN